MLKAGSGSGKVVSVPPYIECGDHCVALVPGDDEGEPTPVVLRATPDPGAIFVGWSGACTGTSAACTLEFQYSTTVVAIFDRPTARTSFPLVVGTIGSGTVRSSPARIACGSVCAGSFLMGSEVTLTPEPGRCLCQSSRARARPKAPSALRATPSRKPGTSGRAGRNEPEVRGQGRFGYRLLLASLMSHAALCARTYRPGSAYSQRRHSRSESDLLNASNSSAKRRPATISL